MNFSTQLSSDASAIGMAGFSFSALGEQCAVGAAGLRRAGSSDAMPATASTRYHTGSITKSMTSTLLAVLIQQWKAARMECDPRKFATIDRSRHKLRVCDARSACWHALGHPAVAAQLVVVVLPPRGLFAAEARGVCGRRARLDASICTGHRLLLLQLGVCRCRPHRRGDARHGLGGCADDAAVRAARHLPHEGRRLRRHHKCLRPVGSL